MQVHLSPLLLSFSAHKYFYGNITTQSACSVHRSRDVRRFMLLELFFAEAAQMKRESVVECIRIRLAIAATRMNTVS